MIIIKKVFFISKACSTHTVKWVNFLSNEFEVHLIYCKKHENKIEKINKNVILHELKFKPPYGYYLNAKELKKLYETEKPDIVNVHFASGYATLTRIAKINPVILSVWGSDVYTFPEKSLIKTNILRKNLEYATIITSTSYAMKKQIEKISKNIKENIKIVPFGVDVEKFRKIDYKKEDENFIIGNVKSLEEIYAIDNGILVVKQVIEKLKKMGKEKIANGIKFYIYGEGSKRYKLQKLINKYQLENQIYLKGKIPNSKVSKVLNKMNLFLITSKKESFGVSLIEAMACEIPVVATNTEGFCEIVKDKKTGYIVSKDVIENMSEIIIKLINDKQKREEIGKFARQEIIKKYNWKENAKEMKKIYYEMVKNQKKK